MNKQPDDKRTATWAQMLGSTAIYAVGHAKQSRHVITKEYQCPITPTEYEGVPYT